MLEDMVENGVVIIGVRRDSRDAALNGLVPRERGSIGGR